MSELTKAGHEFLSTGPADDLVERECTGCHRTFFDVPIRSAELTCDDHR